MKLAVCELPTSASQDRNVRVSTLDDANAYVAKVLPCHHRHGQACDRPPRSGQPVLARAMGLKAAPRPRLASCDASPDETP